MAYLHGGQQIHVDIDLSDIGILSQKPIDFIYKGYNATQFENAQQFKESTNLDNLTQILSQNQSVHVYPFWGDSNLEEIAISRCDIQVQYKFEPTCVFFGAIMSDNYNNNIGHKCSSSKYAGFNRHLVTGEGTIEMIRKTPDNLVEEFQIQGNRLIDGDGVWCYQIPMNLDFVGTDEFGNIIPTDNPKKGIPTRTSVRFRVSMQETNNEGVSRHRAKYLIPNVQDLVGNKVAPHIESGKKFESCYEFGSATPDEYYRDLYWNKVYSVKNYIPRIQTNGKKNTQNYSAIRTVNSNNDVNPAPFNHARFRLAFGYRVLCMIMTIVFMIICIINGFFAALACFCFPKLPFIGRICPFKPLAPACIGVSGGLTEDEDANIEYFPCCRDCGKMNCDEPGCTKETSYNALINVVQQALSQEYDTVNLDFYNDWLNGSLYLPLWFWKKTKKKKFLFGLFSKKAVNSYCACNKNFPKLRVTENCALEYSLNNYDYIGNLKGEKYHDVFPKQKTFTVFGVIKEFVNKAGLNIYYYAPGIPNVPNYKETEGEVSYVRLYSTDIILLGSLNSCDLDNYPNVFTNLPTTTANVPFIATIKQSTTEEEGATYMEGTAEEEGLIEVTGMDWLHKGEDGKPKYGAGLFIDLACNAVYTKPKTCFNLARLSELGVTLDTYSEMPVAKNGNLTYNISLADGMITRYELVDNETRAMFASLNNNGLKEKVYNPNTGYDTYKLRYVYPIDFDGHMDSSAREYTSMMNYKTYDYQDKNYVEFRFGPDYGGGYSYGIDDLRKHFYSKNGSKYSFPLFNNSFYFYFGIHEGSTAIDKFNSRFYATCYKNVKYPFTMTFETESAKWCALNDTDYGTIHVMFNGIKTPYSYKLTNEFSEEILSETGLYEEELYFGYEVESSGNSYVLNTDGTMKKNDIFSEFLTGEKTDIKVENGTYKITVTDANGNVGTQNIILDQVPISMTYETIALGDKYYSDEINKESDFCNENQFFGEIRISGVTVDGKEYRIFPNSVEGTNGEYNVTLFHYDYITETTYDENGNEQSTCERSGSGDTECIKIQIVPQDVETGTFKECTCHGVGGYPEYYISNDDYIGVCTEDKFKVLIFPIWKPNTFTITITQYCPCGGELNDNSSSIMAVVKNGEPFNAYINEAPIKFILGKNENFNTYNPNFYKIGATTPKQLPGWFGLHKESSYVFSATTKPYEYVWGDFVSSVSSEQSDGEDDNYYLSEESLYNIVKYKFQTMFNLAKTCYIVDDGDARMQISHTGGKGPILYRGNYPSYSDIEGYETPNNKEYFETYIANSDGYISCNTYYPNIVGNNYTYIHSSSGIPITMLSTQEPFFNRIFSEYKNLGNYFAAFTRNGSIDNSDPNCRTQTSIKYQQIPYKASPQIDDYYVFCTDAEGERNVFSPLVIKGNNKFKPYFRGEFVDRRLDYNFIILTPYAGDDVTIISESDMTSKNPFWKTGRFSGNTLNGVEMVYNNSTDYEIINVPTITTSTSDDGDKTTRTYPLEYSYDINVNTNTETSKTVYNPSRVGAENDSINIVDKRYYKTILKCGNKKYDINDMYWAYDANGSYSRIKNSDLSIDVNPDLRIINPELRNPGYYKLNNEQIEVVTIENLPTTSSIFSFNHDLGFETGTTKPYNGDFSVTNYPTKRLLDIGNIPSCSKLTFTCSSCSYEIEMGINDNDEGMTITGKTQEIGETEFEIDCRNMISPELPSLEECAANDNYNVSFGLDGSTFYSLNFRIECKVKEDTYNSTHQVYTEFPKLFVIKERNKNENKIEYIKSHAKDARHLISLLKECNSKEFGVIDSTVKDISSTRDKYPFGNFYFTSTGKYWKNKSDGTIAFDDNTNVKNVVYKYNNYKLNGNVDVLGIYLKRNYINTSGDNLSKNINTFQFTSIYDVRKFDFSLYMTCISKGNNTDVSGSTSFTGSTTGATEGEQDLGVSGSGSINATATTKTQRTVFRLTTYVSDDPLDSDEVTSYNQGFAEKDGDTYVTDSLSAVFCLKLGKTRLTTNDVKISATKEGKSLHIDFDVLWTGELNKLFLNSSILRFFKHTEFLYIKMPNNLVYRLTFNINDLTAINEYEDCPENDTSSTQSQQTT